MKIIAAVHNYKWSVINIHCAKIMGTLSNVPRCCQVTAVLSKVVSLHWKLEILLKITSAMTPSRDISAPCSNNTVNQASRPPDYQHNSESECYVHDVQLNVFVLYAGIINVAPFLKFHTQGVKKQKMSVWMSVGKLWLQRVAALHCHLAVARTRG